ncbi:MAG: serine/threonine-protein phosphatase, partial [Solobacterium sp.]|nr:serine/threonine-protein phosphatase [Solobacterium sp.]
MRFLTAFHTDTGPRKTVNQDSLLVMQAETDQGNILLAAVCDGMGGLARGETASAMLVQALSEWFENDLPGLLTTGFRREKLWEQWNRLIEETGNRIAEYAAAFHESAGTTVSAILMIDQAYYIMQVGDSRIYLISDQTWQLTKDQTVVQKEIDEGRMTVEQAMTDPQRNVLLQCV